MQYKKSRLVFIIFLCSRKAESDSGSSSDDKASDNTAPDHEANLVGDGCNDDFWEKDITSGSNVDDILKNIPYELSIYLLNKMIQYFHFFCFFYVSIQLQ